MYMWKYWRETRLVFGVSLFAVALLFGRFLRGNLGSDPRESLDQLWSVLPALLVFQALPIGFLAWLLGSFGVGRNLGEMSGSYLFSRPRRREYFVLSDWGLGMAQLLLVITLLNLTLGFQIHHWMISAGGRFPGSLVLSGRSTTLTTVICLNSIAAFLFAGLVFSVTYFSTIVVKSTRGIILGAGGLLGYVALNIVVGTFWPSIHLPSLLLAVRPQFVGAWQPANGHADKPIALSVAMRFVILLAFPVAAQMLLQKRDIE